MNISLLLKIVCLLLITFTPSVVMAENLPKRDKNTSSTTPKTVILKPNATEGYAPKMRQNHFPTPLVGVQGLHPTQYSRFAPNTIFKVCTIK